MEYGIHFCEHCGGELYNGRCMECGRTYQNSANNTEGESILFNRHKENNSSPTVNPANDRKYAKIFASPKEHFVCVLGQSYATSFITSGQVGKGFAVVSNKRVYFKGKLFNFGAGKALFMTQESKQVDLKDITGTSYQCNYKPLLLPAAIISFIIGIIVFFASQPDKSSYYYSYEIGNIIGILMAITLHAATVVMAILYVLSRRNFLKIEFAGGCIAFNANLYPRQECDNFQKQLRIAKDALIEETENAAANAMRSAVETLAQQPVVQQPIIQQPVVQQPVAAADELLKYAQLVEKGLMTQAEFAEIKAKILAKN